MWFIGQKSSFFVFIYQSTEATASKGPRWLKGAFIDQGFAFAIGASDYEVLINTVEQ